mmetsp:Transcript_34295/g.66360  ORF Transcript_34295/g.66360 Transcript_34295/m.66360 type:complete len:90 (+) Transcript_34295:275-544(+)
MEARSSRNQRCAAEEPGAAVDQQALREHRLYIESQTLQEDVLQLRQDVDVDGNAHRLTYDKRKLLDAAVDGPASTIAEPQDLGRGLAGD